MTSVPRHSDVPSLHGHSASDGFVTLTTVHGVEITLECVCWRQGENVSRGHLLGSPSADFTLCGIATPLQAEEATLSPLGVCESCLKVARS